MFAWVNAPMRRVRTSTIRVSGPFNLAAAVDALDSLAPHRGDGGAYEGWHVIGHRPLSIRVRQAAPRRLVLSVAGDVVERSDLEAAEELVRRMFGLDLDAERFYAEAARDDRVLRFLQARLLGVRPVTAPTPLAALVFVVLADEYGPERARMVIGRLGAAEEPEDLLRLDARAAGGRLGIDPGIVERLRGLGYGGLSGAFGAELLQSMPLDLARNWVCTHAEVGAATADLVLMAGAGRRDVVPKASPQLIAALERYYGFARGEARRRLDELGQRWGEFATWAVFLLVEAVRRDSRAGLATASTL
jgi:3-methyladenine DNA glycosylase/8-oxoguanine DNA glycosylase